MNQLCRVCGENAAGFHFGAFTCEGCKSFFGRACNSHVGGSTTSSSAVGDCKNGGRCVITRKTRTACKACRLRRCVEVGMSKSGSRYGRRSNWFKIHCLLQDEAKSPPSESSEEVNRLLAEAEKAKKRVRTTGSKKCLAAERDETKNYPEPSSSSSPTSTTPFPLMFEEQSSANKDSIKTEKEESSPEKLFAGNVQSKQNCTEEKTSTFGSVFPLMAAALSPFLVSPEWQNLFVPVFPLENGVTVGAGGIAAPNPLVKAILETSLRFGQPVSALPGQTSPDVQLEAFRSVLSAFSGANPDHLKATSRENKDTDSLQSDSSDEIQSPMNLVSKTNRDSELAQQSKQKSGKTSETFKNKTRPNNNDIGCTATRKRTVPTNECEQRFKRLKRENKVPVDVCQLHDETQLADDLPIDLSAKKNQPPEPPMLKDAIVSCSMTVTALHHFRPSSPREPTESRTLSEDVR